MKSELKGCIFDLDGVLVDTAKYHFIAWKRLATELGFEFTEDDNEELKGVSRMTSLDILLEKGGVTVGPEEKEMLARKKNEWYLEYIGQIKPSDVLPGSFVLLQKLKSDGIKIALGSASKNAVLIIERLSLSRYFDAVVDGTRVHNAKPDPEVFLVAANDLGLKPHEVVVLEDAAAGVEAARNAGMKCIGIGDKETLKMADQVVAGLNDLSYDELINITTR
jgi:beta-phosphoglucomutase